MGQRGTQSLKGCVSEVIFQFHHHEGPWRHLLPEWNHYWSTVTSQGVGFQANEIVRDRNSLTEDEVARILEAAKPVPLDHALFRFYIHTGCRRSAATELLVRDVWTGSYEDGHCLAEGKTREKGNHIKVFPIDDQLGQALAAQIRDRWFDKRTQKPRPNAPTYVFPSLGNPHRRCPPDAVRGWLRRLCDRAGVQGNHVFVHGLRHTVATLLYKNGNPLNRIAMFLGHKNVSTTVGYIDAAVCGQEDSTANLNMPWIHDGVVPSFTGQATATSTCTNGSQDEQTDVIDGHPEEKEESLRERVGLLEETVVQLKAANDTLAVRFNALLSLLPADLRATLTGEPLHNSPTPTTDHHAPCGHDSTEYIR